MNAWDRPYFRPGGGMPCVLFVVYGTFPEAMSVSRTEYRFDGLPKKLTAQRHQRANQADILEQFLSGIAWDDFKTNDPGVAQATEQCEECVILRGELDDASTLDYLRNAIGFVTYLLDNGGRAVYEPQRLAWRRAEDWRREVFESNAPIRRNHVVILSSAETASTVWLHTRGMRLFGRPDLSIHAVEPSRQAVVVKMLDRFIEFQALGGVIEDGREVQMEGLPAGMICRHMGDLEDPDFNNVHVDICWPESGHG